MKQEIDSKLFDSSTLAQNRGESVKEDFDLKMKDNEEKVAKGISAEEKCREQNRIRQLAFKACEKMPKDYKSFCSVAAHLYCNAHQYYKEEVAPELLSENKTKTEIIKTEQMHSDDPERINTEVHKELHQIKALKWQNQI